MGKCITVYHNILSSSLLLRRGSTTTLCFLSIKRRNNNKQLEYPFREKSVGEVLLGHFEKGIDHSTTMTYILFKAKSSEVLSSWPDGVMIITNL